MSESPKVPPDYWPCACVRRDRRGALKAIKMHPPSTRRCRVCKCERPPRREGGPVAGRAEP